MLWAVYYTLTALVWLYRARRALQALAENPVVKPASYDSNPPRVSVLVPAKNEASNIEACLDALLDQDYPALQIIVINDHSLDETPQILSRYSQRYPGRLRVLDAPEMPAGWTGKNWALAHGVREARGDWLLFTDADTRHELHSVSSAVVHAEGKDLDLLTLSPRCLVEGFWEKTLQPAAMGFTGLWFPFYKVNSPRTPITFGNGQYLLIRKKIYDTLGGHEKVKGAYLEDFALVREAKQAGRRIECAIGTAIYGTRMYSSFSGIWKGWRRIFLHAFEKNPYPLALKALSVFVFSALPFLLFPFFTRFALQDPEDWGRVWGASLPVLALIGLTIWKTHEVVKAPRGYALFHPLAGLVLTGILLDAGRMALLKEEVKWR